MEHTFYTVGGVALLGSSFGMNMLYLNTKAEGSSRTLWQFGSATINTAIVCYLMFNIIFFRPYSSEIQMFLVGSLLLVGFILEVYFTVVPLEQVGSGLAMALSVINAIIRLFVLVGIRCATAKSTIPGLVGDVVKAVKPVVEASRSVGRELGTIDMQNIYRKLMDSPGIQKWLRDTKSDDERIERKNEIKASLGLEIRQRDDSRK
jgi:hypothetical protein